MTYAVEFNSGWSKFWIRHIPWLGALGYLLVPVNFSLIAKGAYSAATRCYVITWEDQVWLFAIPWCVVAFALLCTPLSVTGRPGFRMGLAMGLATWSSPIVVPLLYRQLA